MAWVDGWQNRSLADLYPNMIDGVPQGQAAEPSLWDMVNEQWAKIDERQKASGLKPGDEGTVTLYQDVMGGPWGRIDRGDLTSAPRDPSTARAYTFYKPPENMFVQPNEGWERFFNQALGGSIQEEYLNPAYTGQWGKDTTNFDKLENLDPFAKDWNAANPYFREIDDDNFFQSMLKDPGIRMMALTALAVGGANALGMFANTGGATAAGAAAGEAAASTVPAWAPGTAGATFNTSIPFLPSIAEAQTLAGIGLTAAEMESLGVGAAAAKIGSLPLPDVLGPKPGPKSIWETAREIGKKLPPMPPGMGSGQATGGVGGDGEQMNLWSDTATAHEFNPVQPYQPSYINIPQAAYPFEEELKRRLALIRGAQ
jgi:hypothetical protein